MRHGRGVHHQAASRRTWPTGRGFDRYYGFLCGETNQWYPDLIHDDGETVTTGRMRTQPGKFTLAGDGLCVGWDSADAVSADYRAPFRFRGGRIRLVAVDVSGQPVVDLEREFQALLARD